MAHGGSAKEAACDGAQNDVFRDGGIVEFRILKSVELWVLTEQALPDFWRAVNGAESDGFVVKMVFQDEAVEALEMGEEHKCTFIQAQRGHHNQEAQRCIGEDLHLGIRQI